MQLFAKGTAFDTFTLTSFNNDYYFDQIYQWPRQHLMIQMILQLMLNQDATWEKISAIWKETTVMTYNVKDI